MGPSKGTQLFGQHIGSGSHLIITEGEIDAMSVHEAVLRQDQGRCCSQHHVRCPILH